MCEAAWDDPADTTYSKTAGGRWNPPGEFGALYLNATMEVARANARRLYAGAFYQPEDLIGKAELQLVEFAVAQSHDVDCVTPDGLRACELPPQYPFGFDRDYEPSRRVALQAYLNTDDGVASRSAAECTATHFAGEELALFDRAAEKATAGRRYRFAEWYAVL